MLETLIGTWWAWVILGFALGVLEVLVPGFIFLGFAIGAVVTGILVGVGIPAGAQIYLAMMLRVLNLAGRQQGLTKTCWRR